MSRYDPAFSDPAGGASDPSDPTSKRRGCWFYGCVFAAGSLVVVLVALAVAAFVIYRSLTHYVEDYTAVAPVELPKVEISEPRRKSAVERTRKFRDALKARVEAEPLVLTGDDLNALVQESPKFKDRVFLTLADDKLKARFSLPLDEFFDTNLTRGRYLNGEAELEAKIEDGEARIEVESIVVDGKPLPEFVRDAFARPSILNLDESGDQSDLLHQIESFEIEDDRIVVKARTPRPEADEPKPAEPPGALEAPKPEPTD